MDLLEKYGIDWALVKRESPLARRLGEVPTWRKEYEDTKVVIYADEGERIDGFNRLFQDNRSRGKVRNFASRKGITGNVPVPHNGESP